MTLGTKKKSTKKLPEPTGIEEIDRLAGLDPCTIQGYVTGVSAYVRRSAGLAAGPKKAGQIRLSNALARALADALAAQLPRLKGKLVTHEQKVAGGLRTAKADVSESHSLDGLRLAVELKPINLAVGRAIWNRFGDIRTFAVNIHLKFPFAVVGGVLVIPIYEETETKEAKSAEAQEEAGAEGEMTSAAGEEKTTIEDEAQDLSEVTARTPKRKTTVHLIERAIERLMRRRSRERG